MTRVALLAIAWLQTTAPGQAPCVYWTGAVDETRDALKNAGISRICVSPDRVDAWRAAGFEAVATSDTDLAGRQTLPIPGIESRVDRVSSTRSPWVNANGWRFVQNPAGRYVYELPAGSAALAAAEAAQFNADVVLKIDPSDLPEVGKVLAFVSELPASALPPVADIAVVDDGTDEAGEVMNLLARRNLLYEPVKEASSRHAVTVALGTEKYSRKEAENPSEFALKVRRELTDDRRTLRVYGSEVVLARLTGDATHRRLQLVNYGGREIDGLRIRLLGAWKIDGLRVVGDPNAAAQDVAVADGATEFSIPALNVYAVVDLVADVRRPKL
jgi:hypothetical protein